MMPLYEFECDTCKSREEHWLAINKRDTLLMCSSEQCDEGKSPLRRLPGGHGMLYFEEGRGRTHYSLSDKPITSPAQHRKLMRQHGLVESGNTAPPRLMARGGPKRKEMREIVDRNKGRWF